LIYENPKNNAHQFFTLEKCQIKDITHFLKGKVRVEASKTGLAKKERDKANDEIILVIGKRLY
jgi:hypothetical protein